MTYSLNELWSLLCKAVAGAGFPPGHVTAIAGAGVWLAQRGFPVCDIIVRAVQGGVGIPKADQKVGCIEFPEARSAIAGVAAIDWVLANEPGFRTVLHDLDEPALMLGLAGLAGQEHNACFIISAGDAEFIVSPDCRFGLDDLSGGGLSGSALRCVELRRSTTVCDALPKLKLATRYDPVETSDFGWDRIAELARRTYVPASDQSRLRGAGAGLTDND